MRHSSEFFFLTAKTFHIGVKQINHVVVVSGEL